VLRYNKQCSFSRESGQFVFSTLAVNFQKLVRDCQISKKVRVLSLDTALVCVTWGKLYITMTVIFIRLSPWHLFYC